MSTTNGHASRAARRRVQNDTPTLLAERETAREEATLARVIAGTAAEVLAALLPQALGQALGAQPWQPGCVFCVMAHKQAMAAHAEALAALRTEYEIACHAAAEEGEPEPAWAEPELPQLGIQQGITFAPVQQAPNVPPLPLPVCYDHFAIGPQVRAVGLVDAAGNPIVARG